MVIGYGWLWWFERVGCLIVVGGSSAVAWLYRTESESEDWVEEEYKQILGCDGLRYE